MKWGLAVILLALVVTAGCATQPQASFYLMEDPQGNVGKVEVSNTTDTATLTQANQAVDAESGDKPFSESREASAEEIDTKFGDALAIVPPQPESFTVYFGSDSSKIRSDSLPVFDQVMAEIERRDSRDISLNGHTDRTGDDEWNMKLSLERANSVKTQLIDKGIKAEYMTIEYYGESKPVVPTADNVSEPKNRRVEVVVR